MIGKNLVILIGSLGTDVELKYTPSGKPVANFSLATNERWPDKSGQKKEKTEWHNIVVWGKLAELCNQYLKKGRTCYLEGKITTRSWDDKDGNKRYKTEIVANQVQFLGGGDQQQSSAPDGPGQTSNSFTNTTHDPTCPGPLTGEDNLPF